MKAGGSWLSTKEVRGRIAVCIAVASALVVLAAFATLEAAFHTWTVGRYFSGHAGFFANCFLVCGVASTFSMILAMLGKGRARIIGGSVSVATITSVILIFSLTT